MPGGKPKMEGKCGGEGRKESEKAEAESYNGNQIEGSLGNQVRKVFQKGRSDEPCQMLPRGLVQ